MATDETLDRVDAIFDRFVAENGAPGVAYGLIEGGELIRTNGHGVARLGDTAPPDADTIFRIASMTKSFTASMVLLLRDEGRLGLDDDVVAYVPEVAGIRRFSTDSPPLSIRHLLTMTAGLPGDDPWGDWQQDLDPDEFGRFLEGGVALVWPPAARFEYSNLGYAILGRVIANVTGGAYDEAIRTRLLEPLGITAVFDDSLAKRDRVASGYVRRDDRWLLETVHGHGAFAPMGGLWASVRDIGRWVAGFTDAFPARDDAEGGHPLRRSSRREMQQIAAPQPPEVSWESVDAAPTFLFGGYGMGLFMVDDLAIGRTAGHGGGYPGFGSHMRWHPASGVGVVVLANARYAPALGLAIDTLRLLLADSQTRIRRHAPWPETSAARAAVERLIDEWDDEVAGELFAMNVDLDEPLANRRAALERLRATHGRLTADDTPTLSYSPAHLEWWMQGERGRARIEILLDPEMPPRVQALNVTSVPEPSERLVAVARQIVELLSAPSPVWPDELPLAPSLDRAGVDRQLRAAEALFGPVELGPMIGGDGERTSTWRLSGDHGHLRLALVLETFDGPLTRVALAPEALEPPLYAD
ncbi:MAG TPA: serine hydrolase domain-containing protein [Candidatus Limnocylindrales bacterium]|nr:serine hydrolase domain-containing protein [Candidatus Limnocylindrales bacterium]